MRSWIRLAAGFAWTCAVASGARAQSSSIATECIAAAYQGQQLRDDGKFLTSREQFLSCARPECPAVVKRDCSGWLTDLNARMPSVIVVLRDAEGRDATGNISIDGGVARPNDGRRLELDPGPHVFRVQSDGSETLEQKVVVRENEKNRVVTMTVAARGAPRPAPRPRSTPETPSQKHVDHVPAETWALGGVAAAGFAGFGILWWRGWHRVDELRDSCAPNCSSDEVASARRYFIAADVSLGIGIVALGGAIVTYVLRPSPSSASVLSGKF